MLGQVFFLIGLNRFLWAQKSNRQFSLQGTTHFPDINQDDVRGCYGISKVAIIDDPARPRVCN